jgi:hypothetical protein
LTATSNTVSDPGISQGYGRAFTVSTVFLDVKPSGLRRIKSSGTRLSVLAGPFAELSRLKEYLSPWDFIAYVIDDPSPVPAQPTYIGEGDGERRIGSQLGNAVGEATQIYIIIADEDTFDKVTTSYVEARLIQICTELNVPLANSAQPYGRGLRIMDDIEQLVGHAEMLLFAAGFTRIDLARRSPPTLRLRLSVTTDLEEMVAMTDDEKSIVPAEGAAYRLDRRDLRVNGYKWNDRFYVMAGSDYARRTRGSLSEDHKARRRLLEKEKWVDPASDTADKMTLGVGFHCRSGAFAAKLVSGEHIDEDSWVAVETTAPTYEIPT